MKRAGVTLLGFLAIAGILYRPTLPNGAPEASVPAEQTKTHKDQQKQEEVPPQSPGTVNEIAPSRNPCADQEGPVQKLQEFVGEPSQAEIPNLAPISPLEFESDNFLIVTLPDPVHTELAMMFDEGVETIERAAGASGYSFERYWSPWQAETGLREPDCTHRTLADKARQQREKQSGLMLFRRRNVLPPQQLLAVFLVGETRTSGISKEQFLEPFP
jgi:hypothetical protein